MIGLKESPLVVGAAPAVNLLPLAERQRRSQVALVRRWAWLAVAAVALILLISLGVAYLGHRAKVELTEAQDHAIALNQQLAKYRDVSTATRIQSTYEAYRTHAMSTDLSWSSLLTRLRSHMPAGATITSFDAATAAFAASTLATGSAAPTAPPGTQLTVTLTVTSTGTAPQQGMLTRLRTAPGVLDVELTGLTSGHYPSYTSTAVVYLDGSVFSRLYAGSGR